MKKIRLVILITICSLNSKTYAQINYSDPKEYATLLEQLPHDTHSLREVNTGNGGTSFIAVNGVQARFSHFRIKENDLEEIRRRKLVVVIAEEDTNVIKLFRKDTELINYYKRGIVQYNLNMKDAITKFWKMGGGIEFKTAKEIEAIKTPSDYVVAFCYGACTESHSFRIPIYKSIISYTADEITTQEDIHYVLRNITMGETFPGTQFALILLENGINQSLNSSNYNAPSMTWAGGGCSNSVIFSQYTYDFFPTKLDIAIAIKMITNQYSGGSLAYRINHPDRDTKKFFKEGSYYEEDSLFYLNTPAGNRVKNKTLLLRNDLVDLNGLTDKKIKAIYPYKYKIVTKKELDDIVMSGDSSYVFAYLMRFQFCDNMKGFQYQFKDRGRNPDYTALLKTIVDNEDLAFITATDDKRPEMHNIKKFYNITDDDIGNWLHPPLTKRYGK